MFCKQQRAPSLTWWVDQSNVVSFLQTCSLHQQSRHSLCPLMELQAGEGAGHRPLEGGRKEEEGVMKGRRQESKMDFKITTGKVSSKILIYFISQDPVLCRSLGVKTLLHS